MEFGLVSSGRHKVWRVASTHRHPGLIAFRTGGRVCQACRTSCVATSEHDLADQVWLKRLKWQTVVRHFCVPNWFQGLRRAAYAKSSPDCNRQDLTFCWMKKIFETLYHTYIILYNYCLYMLVQGAVCAVIARKQACRSSGCSISLQGGQLQSQS